MARRRWIADEVSGNQAALTGLHAEHLIRALRVRVGQEFEVATGDVVRRACVSRIDPGRVAFELAEEVPAISMPQLTVLLSIFKFDHMEWAIEKCTELGVSRIVPVIARRTEAHLAAAAAKRTERWRRIARQASEQSRRMAPPDISSPINLKEATEMPGRTRIVLAESEHDVMLKDALELRASDEVALAFGPEGGWAEAELEMFRKAKWVAASLGDTILRAETAAIAAIAVAVAELQ
jgi:16S rRNA (uracil1498-N3)-methyltransferase